MGKKLIISALAFLVGIWGFVSGFGAGTAHKHLLPDGFVLAGLDGKLTPASGKQGLTGVESKWFFEFDSDLKDQALAGLNLELLPSAALEKMITDVNEHDDADYRLWGSVTKYNGRNFIFPIYSLPFSRVKKQSQESRKTENVTINEPNDVLAIPEDILTKLSTRRIVYPQQSQRGVELKQDFILADRIGFIRNCGYRAQGIGPEAAFVFDAFGRGLEQLSFGVLPCEALQQVQRQQSIEPDPIRFKITGIVTEYKGGDPASREPEKYLLLQRAIRVYSHENFDR